MFAGPKTTRLLWLGTLIGLGIFAVEIAFAYALQGFLFSIGVLANPSLALPSWVPHSRFAYVLGFIAALGTLRGLLYWAHIAVQGLAHEEVKYVQRSRLLTWALQSRSCSISQVTALYHARTNAVGESIYCIQNVVVQATSAVFLAGTLFFLAPVLTAITATILIFLAWPLRWADKKISEVGKFVAAQWDRTNDRLLMSIKNLVLLQIYGTQTYEENLAQESLLAYRRRSPTFYFLAGLKFAFPQTVGLFMVCLIAVMARYFMRFPPGMLVSYFYLFLRLVQTFSTINQSFSSFLFSLPQCKEIFVWWKQHSAGDTRTAWAAALPTAGSPVPDTQCIGWRLEGVHFYYPDADAPVLNALDLDIPPGKAVVIIGPSGSGKSTLLYLLLGCLDADRGKVEVLFDRGPARPLREVRPFVLENVGYVGPECFLIEGTVLENIKYGLRRSPSSEEIAEALRLAECQFIQTLPKGLSHPLTEQGQGLSAGQKQRLALARALLRRPKVLILDEATSNLDMDTEARLINTLMKFKGRMTIVAVTHRQGMLRIADQQVSLHERVQPGA